jgi:hypothetical protein
MSDEPTRYDRYHPIYATPPMTIGKHEWRLIVYPHYTGSNVTSYQWRGDAEDYWRDQRDWPRYNFNDGMYMGLPKTLVRLHEQHRGEIEAALKGIPYQSPEPPQAELFASPLPPHPDGMYYDHASWADEAISAFRGATGTGREAALPDLLADLMHWADRAGYGFAEALDRARRHYEAETAGEGMGGKEPTRAETDPPPAAAAPTLQADNAKLRRFFERWLSAQPGQDYKQYIDPRALAEEARHLIGNAAEPARTDAQATAGSPMPDFRADVFDALMTRLEAFGDHSARLARTQEQKALAESFAGLVAEVDAAIRYTAEATAQHGHPLATANLKADNARLWNTLTRLVYDAAGDQANPLIRDKTLQTIEAARAALAETDPSPNPNADRQPATASDYARTLDATARSAEQRKPDRSIGR